MTEIEDYAYWRAALAGQKPPVEADKPQCGYYELRRGEDRDPVAIYSDGAGGLLADVWSDRVDLTETLWIGVANRPITDDIYWDTRNTRRWADTVGLVEPKPETSNVPGADVEVFTGSNQPADVMVDQRELIDEQIAGATRMLDELLADGIKDRAAADRLANSKDRLKQLWDQAEAERKKEKKPHDDAAKDVQLRWKPTLETAEASRQRAIAAETVWLKAERKRLEAEAAEANRKIEEDRRRQQEEADAAAAAGREAPPAPEPVAPVVAEKPRAGGAISGRRTGLRETRVFAIVEDWKLLIATLNGDDGFVADVRDLAQTYADRAARGGNPLAGTKRGSEETAV